MHKLLLVLILFISFPLFADTINFECERALSDSTSTVNSFEGSVIIAKAFFSGDWKATGAITFLEEKPSPSPIIGHLLLNGSSRVLTLRAKGRSLFQRMRIVLDPHPSYNGSFIELQGKVQNLNCQLLSREF